jgi:hypothetical protein
MRKQHAVNTIENTTRKVEFLFNDFIKDWLKMKYQCIFDKVEKEFK